MKKKLISMAVSFVAALTLFVVAGAATPSQAEATIYWGCPHGTACVWKHADGAGDRKTIVYSQHVEGQCYNFTGSWIDSVTSTSSDLGSGLSLFLYEDINCNWVTGWVHEIHLGKLNFTGPFNGWKNDEASAYMIR
jgi:hypothetical protein